MIVLHYSGVYPERVHKAVSIEGLGVPEDSKIHGPASEQMRYWIESVRKVEKRQPKTYPNIAAAVARMKEANPHLSDEVARHLTLHGTNWDPDGSLIWKFDNYARVFAPYGHRIEDCIELYGKIVCPILFFWGLESFFPVPETDPRLKTLRHARLVRVADAGHWLHHDQLDVFLRETTAFLKD
jgi:pimeloyl-ACP methyl ester carboxylesterase